MIWSNIRVFITFLGLYFTVFTSIFYFPLNPLLLYSYVVQMTILIYFCNMPQLVPFYFINQVLFAFAIIVLLVYVFSKYILPRFVRLFSTRTFISKL